ncbi:RICIN domain-containing protein [Streptomyces sp. NBC_01218]|uniref:RICIN domain-containing protein n=1 Tax=Streptomyces sp. NBC_01218 TaxID=2903780 RepID=UPI002E13DA7F|nr:RICIN domain-containing protein [Streptomyces sp. NBC_01218]
MAGPQNRDAEARSSGEPAVRPSGSAGAVEEPTSGAAADARGRGDVSVPGVGLGAPGSPREEPPAAAARGETAEAAGAGPSPATGEPAPPSAAAATASGETGGEEPANAADANTAQGNTAEGSAEAAERAGGAARAEGAAAAGATAPAAATATAARVGAVGEGALAATGTAADREGSAHRPRKAMLAAAALAGSVLLAVPFLLAGDKHDDDHDNVESADYQAGTTLQDRLPDDGAGVPGAYAAESPKPSVLPSSSASPTAKAQTGGELPVVHPGGAADRQEPIGAASPSPSPKAAAAPKAKAKAAGTPKAEPTTERKAATAAAHPSISRVLIKNLKTQMCADLPAFGKGTSTGPVNQSTCNSNSDDNQIWTLDMRYPNTSPKGGDLYQIRNVTDGLCMDLPGYGSNGITTPISEYPCNGTTADNQLWWLDPRAGGYYWIRSFSSNGLCLDVASANGTGRDSRLTIFPCSDSDDHRWSFVG